MKTITTGLLAVGVSSIFLSIGRCQSTTEIQFTNQIVTFTNLQGGVTTDASLIRATSDQVIFKTNGIYGTVKFTNMSPAALEQIGVSQSFLTKVSDEQAAEAKRAKQIAAKRKAEQERLAKLKPLIEAQRAKQDLEAQLKSLQAQGYLEITQKFIDAYPPRAGTSSWASYQGFWLDATFDNVMSARGAEEAERYVAFSAYDKNHGWITHLLAPKSDFIFDDSGMPFSSGIHQSQHKLDDRVMQMHRGDAIRLIGKYWPGDGLIVDDIISTKSTSTNSPPPSDQ